MFKLDDDGNLDDGDYVQYIYSLAKVIRIGNTILKARYYANFQTVIFHPRLQ